MRGDELDYIYGLAHSAAFPVSESLKRDDTLCRRADRLSAARSLYMIQNLSVTISGAAALVALSLLRDTQSVGFIMLIALSILFTSSSHLASMGTTLTVEKGWTKRLCCEDSAQLARMNAGLFLSLSAIDIAVPLKPLYSQHGRICHQLLGLTSKHQLEEPNPPVSPGSSITPPLYLIQRDAAACVRSVCVA